MAFSTRQISFRLRRPEASWELNCLHETAHVAQCCALVGLPPGQYLRQPKRIVAELSIMRVSDRLICPNQPHVAGEYGGQLDFVRPVPTDGLSWKAQSLLRPTGNGPVPQLVQDFLVEAGAAP